jgi:protocatechuate 3,4-dioxygenase beta subunit
MSRQRVFGAVLAAAVLAVIGLALFLVMANPPDGPTTDDGGADEVAHDVGDGDVKTPEKRRRAGHEGQAVIFGRLVRGKERAPLPGQTVRLLREGMKGWTATTDDGGRFRFERLPKGGPFEVAATVADCAPVRLPGLALDRREELDIGDIRLDQAVSVSVIVRSMNGEPIAGALVEAYAQASADWTGDWSKRLAQIGVAPVAVTSLRTDGNGVARFPEIAAGTWGFRASAEGFARRGRGGRVLEPEDEEGRKPIEIHLPPGYGLSGVVTDQDDAPIPDALVLAMKPNQMWSPQSAPLHFRATADDEGRYAFDAMPAGEFAILASRPDGVPAQVAVLRVPDLTTFDVHLRLGGVLEGTVTEAESGQPVPDVEVRATGWAQNSQRIGVAVTDAGGRYRIDTMLEGIVNQVVVDRPGWVVVHEGANPWQQISLQKGSTARHDIEIREGATVTGVVRGPDGPLSGAAVTLHVTSNMGWSSKNGKTDSAGRYRIEGLGEGKGLLQIQAEGHTQRSFPVQWWEALNNRTLPEEWSVDVPAGGEVTKDAELVAGGAVEGIVRDDGGDPIAGATVNAWTNGANQRTETDGEGAFRLTGLPFDVDVNVTANAEGRVSRSEQVRVSEGETRTGLELALRSRPVVRGTVTSSDGALPPGTHVQISRPASFDSNQPYSWQDPERRWDSVEMRPVAADGTYAIELPWDSGQLIVRASGDGASPVESEPVTLAEGTPEYRVDLELTAGRFLEGRVVEEGSGAPVEGALVALGTQHPMAEKQPWMAQNVFPPLRAVSDAEGRFRVPFTKDGKGDLRVERDGYVETKRTQGLPAVGQVEVRLAPALRIAGVVHFSDREPAAGVQVSYTSNKPQAFYQSQTVISGDDGRFEIRDLAKGAYTVTIQPPWNGDVNVRQMSLPSVEAGTTDLEITVEHGLAITGRVLGADGEGLPNTWINAQRESADNGGVWRGASSQADGSFKIVGLDEGTYTLHVNGSNGTVSQQVKGVAAGTQDVVVRLADGLEIRGRLVDTQGSPIPNESLYASRIEETEEGVRNVVGGNSSGQTNADGEFVIHGLAPGEYVIQRMQGNGSPERRNHVLEGGGRISAGATGVELVLSAGALITGTVVDGNGNAVRDANSFWVKAQLAGGQDVKWSSVKADGTFEIAGLAADVDYTLRTMGGGFRPGSAGPVAGGTDGVQIEVEPGLTCSGRLVDSRGNVIASANITFRAPDSDDYTWAQTDDVGNFETSGLDDGEYAVTAWIHDVDENGTRSPQQRQVKLGIIVAGTSDVTLEVPAPE